MCIHCCVHNPMVGALNPSVLLPLVSCGSYEAVEDVLQVRDLYDPRTQWASFIVNGLKVRARGSTAGPLLAPLSPCYACVGM